MVSMWIGISHNIFLTFASDYIKGFLLKHGIRNIEGKDEREVCAHITQLSMIILSGTKK